VLAVSRAIGDHCLRPFVIAQPEVSFLFCQSVMLVRRCSGRVSDLLMCAVILSNYQSLAAAAAAAAAAASETARLTLIRKIICCKLVAANLLLPLFKRRLMCSSAHASESGQHAFIAAHRAHDAVNMQRLMPPISHSSQACTALLCLASSPAKLCVMLGKL